MGLSLEQRRHIKRALDVVVSGGALVGLAPVLGTIIGLQLVYHGWPPFFVQERPGLGGRIFRMIKFRSMTSARGADGQLLPDAERLTSWGKILRATSLDEVPELLNVLRGEMSLVGPRPLLTEYLALYSPEQMRRHEVRPGITGWAQVHGRNTVSWDDKFELDVWYVDNWSLRLDATILLKTILSVLRREGISADGEATMSKFSGSSRSPARGTVSSTGASA